MLFHLGSERVISLCLPLYLGDEMIDEKTDPPYLELFITITVQPPCITIHPPQILFTPAPLEISATATVTLLALGYPRLVYTDTVPIAHLWMPPLIIPFMRHELLSQLWVSWAMMMKLDFHCIYTLSVCGKLPAAFGMRVWKKHCSLYKLATFFIPVGFLSIKPEQINWHVWTMLDFVYIVRQ